MSYLDRFRQNLDALYAAYMGATGYRATTTSQMVAGDPKFYGSMHARDMRVGTYDAVTARFSAIWPTNCPWPDGIERPEPAQLDGTLARPARVRATASIHPDWPADKPWPADIPRPVASPKHFGGPTPGAN